MGAFFSFHFISIHHFYLVKKDTTGRERFSSLSTAFFRGVDAALLVFDASDPTTMHAMKSWWADFAIKPLSPTSMQQSIAALW